MEEIDFENDSVKMSQYKVEDTEVPYIKNDTNKLKGIGGWLIVVAISLIISLIRHASQIITFFRDISYAGWLELKNPASAMYDPNLSNIIAFEAAGTIVFLILIIILIFLFLKKKRYFPQAYILMLILNAIFISIDNNMMKSIPDLGVTTNDISNNLLRSGLSMFVWISYFAKSERVKNTFVK